MRGSDRGGKSCSYEVRQGEESGEEAANLTLNREAHWLAETPLSAKVVAEFLGTFFVIVTRGLVSNTPFDNGTGPFAVGSALAAMIYSVRGISGAHFNPAVSFAVWLSGRKLLTGLSLLPYIFTQLLAGIAGGLVFNALSEESGRESRSTKHFDSLEARLSRSWVGAKTCVCVSFFVFFFWGGGGCFLREEQDMITKHLPENPGQSHD